MNAAAGYWRKNSSRDGTPVLTCVSTLLPKVAGWVPADLVETLVTKVTPDESLLADPRADLAILDRPEDWLGEDADAVLDEILRSSLTAAVAEVEQLLGPDREQWAWGRLHVSASCIRCRR